MSSIANELIEQEQFGFENLKVDSRTRKNKKANGVHKYLKTYLKMYDWRQREQLIIKYTEGKLDKGTNKPIKRMKSRYIFIQDNFNSFVEFLKQITKKQK